MKTIINGIKKVFYILTAPQKILCTIVLILTLIGSILECVGVAAILPVVSLILVPEKLRTITAFGLNNVLEQLTYELFVVYVIGAVILIYFLKNVYFIFMSWFRIKFSCKIVREAAIRMMESYMCRGYKFFLGTNYGELSQGVGGDSNQMFMALNAMFRLISDALTIVLICLFMFVADWSLALAVFFMSGVCVLLIYFIFKKKMEVAGEQMRKYSMDAGLAVYQGFMGIKDVLIMRKQRYFVDRYEKSMIEVQKAQCVSSVAQESPSYIIEAICVIAIMIVVGIRICCGGANDQFVATLAGFAVGAFRILPSLGRISISINQLTVTIPSIEAMHKNLIEAQRYEEAHPEIKFEKNTFSSVIERGQNKKNNFEEKTDIVASYFSNTISLENIYFGYESNVDNIIEDVSMEIKKGQSIAFIGASGAGKSTIVDILLGLLIPQSGRILVDGEEISKYPEAWSKCVSYVPQSVFLFSKSIKENIGFGENLEDIDDNRVWEALELADLAEFVRSLPEGLLTKVGDRGVRLSGGQRQRIAIARALYRRPKILVLDEATSALDNDTEKAIMDAIDSLQGKMTIVIVAHRLTTVQKCDTIYEVKDKGVHLRDKHEVLENAGIVT